MKLFAQGSGEDDNDDKKIDADGSNSIDIKKGSNFFKDNSVSGGRNAGTWAIVEENEEEGQGVGDLWSRERHRPNE